MVRSCPHCGAENRVPPDHLADQGRCGRCKGELAPLAEPLAVDAAAFDDITQNAKVPVLVDFWAEWCGPCRMVAPEVKRTAQDLAGKALVLKVDTEANPELARRFNVQGIPNFLVFSHGRKVRQQAGAVNHRILRQWLEQAGYAMS
jgi:thioredoxin 2